jgi:hypothetical protein
MRRALVPSLLAASTLTILGACGGPGGDTSTLTPPAGDAAASVEAGPGSSSGGPSGGDSAPASDATADGSGPHDGAAPADAGAASCPMLAPGAGPTSKWVYVDAPGHLAYGALPKGERILDFSSAGYMGGGVAIPAAPVQQTVKPSGGSDDTAAIQAAIDAVSKLPATSGLRGAVLLAPGTFNVAGTITLGTSGVVLRGSGSGTGGTVLNVTGSPRMVITVGGTGKWQESSTSTDITDDYVPSGATSFHVTSSAGLSPGTPVLVDRTVTAAWIHFMGMDTMVRNGNPETWVAAGTVIHADRTIASVQGTTVTLDAPLSDSFDVSTWGSGAARASVHPYTFAGRIEQVGVEAMHLVAPPQTVPINQPIFGVLSMDAVKDAWVSDVVADEFTTGFVVGGTAKAVTIQDSAVHRAAPIDGSQGYPFHFSVDGQGVLVQRCTSEGIGVFSYATQETTPGPNVVLQMTVPEDDAGAHNNLQPHQRWATGLLVDDANTPTGGIALMNRGWDGSGHGWAIGFGVVWNGVASSLLVQQPPGAQNWSIGAKGTQTTASAPGSTAGALPQGIIDSPGVAVAPQSLYLAQLCERLGPSALKAIGY